jgi:uncharacterized protein
MPVFAPLIVVILIILAGWISGRRFRSEWRILSLVTVGCGLADWLMLAALPRLGLSYGPIGPPLALIELVRSGLLLAALPALALVSIRKSKNGSPLFSDRFLAHSRRAGHLVVWLIGLAQGMILLLAFYGLYIEPFRLTVSERYVPRAPSFIPGRPLRILQISDLHVERITSRERAVLAAADRLRPDLIVLTGDFVNLDYQNDPLALQDARAVLSRLSAPYGVFAVSGTTDTPYMLATIFEGTNILVLDDEKKIIPFPGGSLYLLGVTNTFDGLRDQRAFETLSAAVPNDAYTILLYHTPDMIEAASASGTDLYFAGHTHGGQVRLPFYGALVTSSRYGKKYEMGLYQVGPTTLYVSRGIGMEGLTLPRVRFLCPPELVIMDLGE